MLPGNPTLIVVFVLELVCVVAYFLKGFSGFGPAIVLVPTVTLAIGPEIALANSALIDLVVGPLLLFGGTYYKRDVDSIPINYEKVASAIIEEQRDDIGEAIDSILDDIDGVTVEDGSITIEGPVTRKKIEEIVDAFHEIQGEGAYGICRQAVSEHITAHNRLNLPPELVPREVKQRRFVSGFNR